MSQSERRQTERLLLHIPVRVIGSDRATGDFAEDTQTEVVNQTGARITLKHRIAAGATLRIINLENHSEADFRVVGLLSPAGTEPSVWGMESIEPERNIWGIQFPPPISAQGSNAGALLECRGCKQQALLVVSPMEIEVLESTGLIVYHCSQCKKETYWAYADTARHPRELSPSEPAAPPSPVERAHRRLGMKLPVLVRNQKGEEEIAKTENISKGGLAVSLAMELAVGDMVSVVCPHTPGGQNIEQKAAVRHRAYASFGGMRLYGLAYVK